MIHISQPIKRQGTRYVAIISFSILKDLCMLDIVLMKMIKLIISRTKENKNKNMALTAQMEECKINRIKLATQIEVDEVPCIPKSYLQCLSCLV